MKVRIVLVVLGTLVLAMPALEAGPEPPIDLGGNSPFICWQVAQDDLRLREQILARQFSEFEQSLLKLIQRLERSSKEDDRDRAKVLRQALEKCKTSLVSTQFDQIVDILKKQELKNLGQVEIL